MPGTGARATTGDRSCPPARHVLERSEADNRKTVARRRLKRRQHRAATRTLIGHCFPTNHTFEITDGRHTTCCGDPDHVKAHRRERNRINQARYQARHKRPRGAHMRLRRYRPKARYIITEDFAFA